MDERGTGRPKTSDDIVPDGGLGVGPVVRAPLSRIVAWVVDWGCILVWVAITAAVGVPLFLAGVTDALGTVTLNLVAAAVVILPVTFWLARLESGARQATPGKRLRGLVVVTAADGSRAGFGRALLRNTLKIAVPWLIGHAAVYAIVETGDSGAVPIGVWVLTGASYVLPIGYLASLFVGTGRTPYDRLSGTAVIGRTRSAMTGAAA
ncbi:RDD family protein [Paractinoplanes rhizophilus]|uniref:RDD family protein n=1 Tax=Paractinoplanes rhizophilus TaxID=1416877 RepID=A0ABW2I2F5_9ACTN|nr:RDD family protein [Actinoplanes sp.]